MAKTVWFGTEHRMAWVPAPSASGVDRSVQSWSAGQQFLDGGQWRRRSASGSRKLQMTWPIMSSSEVRSITAFLEGTYGPGPFYYCDPFAWQNMLPQWLAVPWLAADDAPVFAVDLPRPLAVANPDMSHGYPAYGAVYAVTASASGYRFPVPPNTTAYFGWHGSATGTAVVKANGTTVTPLGVDTATLTNYTYTAPVSGGWVELSVAGSGSLTLFGLHLSLGTSAPVGDFVKGEGYVGLSLDGDPQTTGYTATDALDRQGLSAGFVETEASSSSADYDSSTLVLSAYLIDPTTGDPYKAVSL